MSQKSLRAPLPPKKGGLSTDRLLCQKKMGGGEGEEEAVGGRRGKVERKKKFSTLNSSKDRTYTASRRRLEAPRRGVIDVLYNQLVCLSVHREERQDETLVVQLANVHKQCVNERIRQKTR